MWRFKHFEMAGRMANDFIKNAIKYYAEKDEFQSRYIIRLNSSKVEAARYKQEKAQEYEKLKIHFLNHFKEVYDQIKYRQGGIIDYDGARQEQYVKERIASIECGLDCGKKDISEDEKVENLKNLAETFGFLSAMTIFRPGVIVQSWKTNFPKMLGKIEASKNPLIKSYYSVLGNWFEKNGKRSKDIMSIPQMRKEFEELLNAA
jgi:hypothetical protein